MNWVESNLVQLMYWLDAVGRIMPLVLTAAVVFIFFLVQSYGRRVARMEFFLDRIDNHLREITYFIKEYHAGRDEKEAEEPDGHGDDSGRAAVEDSRAQRLRE